MSLRTVLSFVSVLPLATAGCDAPSNAAGLERASAQVEPADRAAPPEPKTEPRGPKGAAPGVQGAASGQPAAAPQMCNAICGKTEALSCGTRAECDAACREMNEIPICRTEMAAFAACLGREPIEHWTCGADRIPEIRDGFCDPEQAAFVRCLSAPTLMP
jgi:hypothetical protein